MGIKEDLKEGFNGLRRGAIVAVNHAKDKLGIKGTRTVFTVEPGEDDEPTLVEKKISLEDTGMSTFEIDNGEELPNISFDGRICLIALGQWMGILKSTKVRSMPGFEIREHLSADELDERTFVLNSELLSSSREFAKLLAMAGIATDETAIISEFDEEKAKFKMHLDKSGQDYDMSYSYGNMDDCASLVFKQGEENTTYNFFPGYKEYPRRIELAHYTRINPETGVKYWFYNCEYFLSCSVTDGDHHLSIHINYPESLEDQQNNPYIDVDKIREVLMGIRLPQNALETFALVQSCLHVDYKTFTRFELKEVKKEEIEVNGYKREKETVTNLIDLSRGNRNQIVVTKDGKTITVNKDNSWSNKSDTRSIAEDSQGYVSYHAVSILKDNLSLVSPVADYEAASKEVDEIKRLTLTAIPEDNITQE